MGTLPERVEGDLSLGISQGRFGLMQMNAQAIKALGHRLLLLLNLPSTAIRNDACQLHYETRLLQHTLVFLHNTAMYDRGDQNNLLLLLVGHPQTFLCL